MSIISYLLILYPWETIEEEEYDKFRLLRIGQNLTSRFKDPSNQSPDILEEVQAFIGELYSVYEMVSTRDGDLIKKGVEEYDTLVNSKVSLHFKMDVDFSKLKEPHYWSYDDRVLHIRDMFNETDILWNRVTDRVNYIRF